MFRLRYKLANKLKGYSGNREGATAIEFALLAVPFFMLLFAILELAIIFFISSTLNYAVSEAGRNIRTGNFQNCGKDAFKAAVCTQMSQVGNCNGRLRLDVMTSPTFSTITLPVPPDPPDPTAANPNPDIPNGDYNETVAGAPVVIRALYYHTLILPPQMTMLENLPGKGVHLINTVTAFQNEPFPTGTCI